MRHPFGKMTAAISEAPSFISVSSWIPLTPQGGRQGTDYPPPLIGRSQWAPLSTHTHTHTHSPAAQGTPCVASPRRRHCGVARTGSLEEG